jgi:hypothetical protein
MMPVALFDDTVEGDAVSGAAPGEEEDVGVGCDDGFGGGLDAGCAYEGASGCGDEFGDPGLGVDEGIAPLFAVDGRFWLAGCGFLCGKDGLLEALDDGFGFGGTVYLARDEAVSWRTSERVCGASARRGMPDFRIAARDSRR